MCGIFGYFPINNAKYLTNEPCPSKDLVKLSRLSIRRGSDAQGLLAYSRSLGHYTCTTVDDNLHSFSRNLNLLKTPIALGHSRLVTNGGLHHQPVTNDFLAVAHNGIIVNDAQLQTQYNLQKSLDLDSEIILLLYQEFIHRGYAPFAAFKLLFSALEGTASIAFLDTFRGHLFLASNNSSLYLGTKKGFSYFSSERFHLESIHCTSIASIYEPREFSAYSCSSVITRTDLNNNNTKSLPIVNINATTSWLPKEKLLKYRNNHLKRCTKCILPSSMPYIEFDSHGVCNYCRSYRKKEVKGSLDNLQSLINRYNIKTGNPCIVPFSGGRDSTYALHLAKSVLDLPCITYTYDWGLVTDLARRNISRVCSKLNVENIVISADIRAKRKYVRNNLLAWLKKPNLGMISLLTAGDKFFFRYVETIKRENNLSVSLWGVNPYEVTHFKAGFLGLKPDFATKHAYSHPWTKQLLYQALRVNEYIRNPSYINDSIFDTLMGEFWRSVYPKKDVYHVFDYVKWTERDCENVLDIYDWERAVDTNASWRIGDGTAAFYNYVYYTVAGFTEFDTFRSNQIREGEITRDEALKLVEIENQPRINNICWYLELLDLPFEHVIATINSIPPLY